MIYTKIRSLIFCLRYLPFRQAIKIPIRVSNNVGQLSIKGKIIIDSKQVHRSQIKIGYGGSPGLQSFKSGLLIAKGGSLVFTGRATIAEGTVLRVDSGGTMTIGNQFYCNKNCYFRCYKSITIGDNVLVGWNNTFNDTDGHCIKYEGKAIIPYGPIRIGNHVWITTNVIINKNVYIPDGCVVAQGSIVNIIEAPCSSLLGGIPARVVKPNITWEV
jgi:acetyltransferase-like isoleucine patch superfamily enzyme